MPEILAPKDSAIIDTNYKRSNSVKHDPQKISSVINDIVEADDTVLLTSIYRESMRMDGDENEHSSKEMLGMISKIGKEEFLREILSFDLDGYLNERENWLKTYTTSFNSVLDDIITVSNGIDVNEMDCY